MNTAAIHNNGSGFKFTEEDIVNPDDYEWHDKVFLLHDCGRTVAVVYARCLQDARDEAADSGKMDRYAIAEEDEADFDMNTGNPSCSFLGNDGKPFNIESLGAVEFPKPPISLVSLINGRTEHETP